MEIYERIKAFIATLNLSPQTYEDLIKAIAEALDI